MSGFSRLLRWLLPAILTALTAGEASAHKLGESYLYLQIYRDHVSGRFEIALSDLNPALGLSGTDQEITADNVEERIDFLQSYYREHVTISTTEGPLPIEFTTHDVLEVRGGFVN